MANPCFVLYKNNKYTKEEFQQFLGEGNNHLDLYNSISQKRVEAVTGEKVKPFITKEQAPKNQQDRFGRTKTTDTDILLGNKPDAKGQILDKTDLGTTPDGIKVYSVNGKYVRDNIDSDFGQGGNYMSYPEYIPKGEYWLEKGLEDEFPDILKHEHAETLLMEKGNMSYSTDDNKGAHDIVKRGEDAGRGEGLGKEKAITAKERKLLEKVGVKLTGDEIDDLPLTKEEPTPPKEEPTRSEQLKDKEEEIPPKEAISAPIEEKPTEIPPKAEVPVKATETGENGIKYGDKLYQSVEQIQDDFKKFPDFQTYNKVLDQVRHFEDGLKTEATTKSKTIGKKMKLIADKAEKEDVRKPFYYSDLAVRFFPLNISRANTALWKPLRAIRNAASDWVADKVTKGLKSQNDVLRWFTKLEYNLFPGFGRSMADILGSKEVGIGKLEMMGTAKTYAPEEANQIRTMLLKLIDSNHESSSRVLRVLDPEITEGKLTYDDLTDAEKKLHDVSRDLNDWGHETTYADNFIPTETYLKNRGKYIARMYDVYEMPEEVEGTIKSTTSRAAKINADIFKMRKEVDDWKKEHAITDVTYLTAKRVLQTIQNHAVKEYIDRLQVLHPDLIRDVAEGEQIPKGFRKLGNSYSWGGLRGKVVADHLVEDFTGFFYANHAVNSMYDALKLWDRGQFVQFYKKFRTVFNPFVQIGNFTGNMFFSSIAGINPVVLTAEYPSAVKDMKSRTEEYKKFSRSGTMGATGLTGDMKPLSGLELKRGQNIDKSKSALAEAVALFEKVDDTATKLYQANDDVAKYSAYRIWRRQGLTHDQAIERTYNSFQNYAMVGKTWDVSSKIPIVGPRFVKFQADLQRILLNAITTSPLTTIGTLMLISAAGNIASKLSGETEEEKKERESRKGVAKIPLPFGTSIPLSFKVGKKEVNLARYFSPLYLYRYEDSETDLAELSRFLPVQLEKVPTGKLGETKTTLAFADPAFGWIGNVLFDRDYRGASVQNPDANVYQNPNPPFITQRLPHILDYIGRTQVPFYRAAQDMYDGITGNLDYYGRKRTWTDAILNNLVKIQEFDKPELKNYVEGNIGYLTNKFSSLSQRMGDANNIFLRTMKDAEDRGMSQDAIDRLYKIKDKDRAEQIKNSLDQQIPVMRELERLTEVYKGWYPDDPFVQKNFMALQSGKNQVFNVQDDIDLQKKYPVEYKLLRANNLLRKPDVPSFYNEEALTDVQKKEYTSTYWSEYIRNIDALVGLTKEDIEDYKKTVIKEKESRTKPLPFEENLLQKMATEAAQRAKKMADIELGL